MDDYWLASDYMVAVLISLQSVKVYEPDSKNTWFIENRQIEIN